MFALDLFNNDHERRLAEGAVDQLEQRRIDDLAMKMDDLVARARTAHTPEAKAALVREFQKCKAERDGYYKIKDECMGYGGLGETVTQQELDDIAAQDREHEIDPPEFDSDIEEASEQDLAEGLGDNIKLAWVKALAWLGDKAMSISKDPSLKARAKEVLAQQTAKVEQIMLNTIAGHPREEELKKLVHYIVTQLNQQQTIGDFMRVLATLGKQFKTEREKFSETEKNQDIADKEWLKKMGREPQGPVGKAVATGKEAVKWLGGRGGPGKEGPTYESFQKKNLTSKRINLTESRTYKLWESAGQKIVEYKLTPDQIQQLFQQVEQGATAAGGNRTVVGQGKDAASAAGQAVSQAWGELKDKIYNSKPMAGFAAEYDKAAEALKQATGGDAGVMKYIQKYRDFAKKHPYIQTAVYAALVGAAGISGAGLGGAAALTLLKTADLALQGKDIRSAAWGGIKTGAMALASHQLMQYFMKPDVPVPPKTEVKLPDGEIYIVKPGDTMSGIAKATGNSVKELVDANQGQSIDMSPDGWLNPYKDALSSQDALGNHIPTSGDTPNIEIRPDWAGRNLDRLDVGDKVWVPHGVQGTNVYDPTGVGTNARTIADIAKGIVPDDPISQAQYLKFHPGATPADAAAAVGQSATTAGQAASGAAKGGYDAVQNAATNALASTQSPSQWTNTAGQKIASAGNLPNDPDAINRLAQYGKINPGGGIYNPRLNPELYPKPELQESYVDRDLTVYTWALNESIGLARGGVQLTNEGIGSMFKSAASKVGQWAQTKGHNLTTRVTADKLQSAWQKAGSPTDSDEIAAVLQTAGVTPEIINQIYAAMKIPAPKQAGVQQTAATSADATQQAAKKHTGGRVAGQLSQTPNAVRQRQARAAQKQPATTGGAGAGVFGQMAKDLSTTGTSSTGGMTQATPTGLRHTANPNNPNMAPATPTTAQEPTTAPAARPNYGAQTGAGAKVAYNQPTTVQYPNVNATQPAAGPKTPKATPATTAPGQTITVGGQKIKPTDPLYDKLANAPIKQPAEVDETVGQRLHAGDPIIVTAPNEFEGKTGEIYELSPSGTFVIVDLYNHGKHSMHLSDVEYNQYADQEDQDEFWNDDKINESNMSELDAMRQDLELMNDRQFYTAYGISKTAFQQKYRSLLKPVAQQDAPVDEGWQDFNKVEPYAVCLAGKPVKKFDYYEEARRFHDNWKQKLYREGNKEKADKITLMPLNLDEGKWNYPKDMTTIPKFDKDADDYLALHQGAKFARKNKADRKEFRKTQKAQAHKELMTGKKDQSVAENDQRPNPSWNPGSTYDWTDDDWKEAKRQEKEWIQRRKVAKAKTKKVKEQGVAEDTGSWIVYDPETKQIKKRFKTHTAGKSYAKTHGLGFASSEYYFDRVKDQQGVAEGQQPMNRNAVIQKLETIYTKLYKDEDPESYDVPAAVDYWHSLPADQLAMEFEDAIDRLKQSRGIKEAETDFSKRRARERDVDAGRPVKPLPRNPQTDYARKRAKDKRDMELGEDDVDDFVKAGGKITYGKPQKGPRRPGLSLASRHIGGGGDKMKPSRTGRAGAAIGGKPVGIKEEQDNSGVERAILNRIMVAHTDLLMKFGPEKVMQAAEEVAYNVGDVDEIGSSDVSAYVNQVRQILGAEA